MSTEQVLRQITAQFKHLDAGATLWGEILEYGETMAVRRLTFREAKFIVNLTSRLGGLKTFKVKQCYFNSQRMASIHALFGGGFRLEYCEGYITWDACSVPIDHAWLLLNGKVVDLTLRAKSKTTEHSYYGVRIPVSLISAHQNRTKVYGPVIEGPYQGQALKCKARNR